MKYRKVIESGAVAVFAVAIAMTAVTAKDVTGETEQYTREEVFVEAEQEVATKAKTQVDLVSSPEDTEKIEEDKNAVEAFTPMAAKDSSSAKKEGKKESVKQAAKDTSASDKKAESGENADTEKKTDSEDQTDTVNKSAADDKKDSKEKLKSDNKANSDQEQKSDDKIDSKEENKAKADTKEENKAKAADSKEENKAKAADTKEENKAKAADTKEENKTEAADSKKENKAEAADSKEENKAEAADSKEENKTEAADSKEENKTEAADTKEENKAEAADSKEEIKANAADAKAAQQPAEEVSEWATKLMPNVEEFLNIRTEASEEAELAGKLRRGDVADILERGEEWSKISSGSVEGYVKNEFCVFDDAAEAMANELGTVYATAQTGGLRVRAEASEAEGTTILDVLEEGGKIKVDTSVQAPEGWVAVKSDEAAAFVSAQYVNVELELGKAISIEEEQAAIRKAQEEEAAKQAAQASAASHSSDSGTAQRGAVSASYDDVTLLGALIQCEAGSESYEGKVAVGAVVMNRLRSGYAGSISGVIYQSGQFSPASSGALSSVLASGVSGSCLSAAQEAINGADNVGGATSFRNVNSGMPGTVIGNHVFF